MSNGYGTYRCTRSADMAAYDACPPRVRWLLRNAVGPWASKPILRDLRDGRTEAEIAKMIRRGDREDTIAAYGRNHPEAAHV